MSDKTKTKEGARQHVQTDQAAPELSPCPFCGGEARECKDGEYFLVHCTKCRAETYSEIRRVARSSWNRRADIAAPSAPAEDNSRYGWTCTNCRTSFHSEQQARKSSDTNGGPVCPGCKAHGQYTYRNDLHSGNPCVRCGISHDEVPSGPCVPAPAEVEGLVERLNPDESHGPVCPFCRRDPYHYVDVGVGFARAAVECCDLGIALFQHGDEQLSEVVDRMCEAATALTAQQAEIERLSAELAAPSAPAEVEGLDYAAIDAIRLEAFLTNDPATKQRFLQAAGRWFQYETIRALDRYYALTALQAEIVKKAVDAETRACAEVCNALVYAKNQMHGYKTAWSAMNCRDAILARLDQRKEDV